MPISANTQDLLTMAISAVRQEGYGIIGCYLKGNDEKGYEIVHYSDPPQSRSGMCELVSMWLDVLEDNSIDSKVVETEVGSPIKLTDA